MRAVEPCERRLQGAGVLLAEGRERREGVGDAEKRRAVAVKLEVRCALRDELDKLSAEQWLWSECVHTEAGSSSRSIVVAIRGFCMCNRRCRVSLGSHSGVSAG
jgi:hypothetical protein